MRVSEPVLLTVDPADDAGLRAWHAAMHRGQSAERIVPLIISYAELAAWLRQPDKRTDRVLIRLSIEESIVGTALLELPLLDNTHLAEFELTIPPEHRNRGYGSVLLAHVEQIAAASERTTFVAEVFAPPGAPSAGTRFAERHGYRSALHEDRYLLELPVAEERLTSIEAEAAPHHRDYELVSWLGACPPEYQQAYADLHTAMGTDVPMGELDFAPEAWDVERVREMDERAAREGITSIRTVALAPGGEPVGYSVLQVLEHDPGQVNQADTLVLRAHRGHRLGAALKARNLRLLAADHPDRRYVHTWTAVSNLPMRRINETFGFRAVEESHSYQRTLD